MDFKKAITVKSSRPSSSYLARYKDGQWYVKYQGKLIPIQLPDVMATTVFYSTPINPTYKETKKSVIAKGGFTSTLQWWSPIYHGMKLEGIVKDGMFIIKKLYHAK